MILGGLYKVPLAPSNANSKVRKNFKTKTGLAKMELFDFPDSNNLKETVNLLQKYQINHNIRWILFPKANIVQKKANPLSLSLSLSLLKYI